MVAQEGRCFVWRGDFVEDGRLVAVEELRRRAVVDLEVVARLGDGERAVRVAEDEARRDGIFPPCLVQQRVQHMYLAARGLQREPDLLRQAIV